MFQKNVWKWISFYDEGMPKVQFPKITTAKKAFVAYLTAHPRKQFWTSSPDRCAIAQFVASQIESKKIGVSVQGDASDHISLSYYGERKRRNGSGELIVEQEKLITIPEWMDRFIEAFDNMPGSDTDNTVTGAAILKAEIV